MLSSQSVLVTVYLFALHTSLAWSTSIPAGTSPAHSRSPSPELPGSRSRSLSPAEHLQASHHQNGQAGSHHDLPPIDIRLALLNNRRNALQRSQSLRMPTFRYHSEQRGYVSSGLFAPPPSPLRQPETHTEGPTRYHSEQRGYVPASSARVPYQRSHSDSHRGLHASEGHRDSSLDLRLTLRRQSSTASSTSRISSHAVGHKRPHQESGQEKETAGDPSKRRKLDHSGSFQESSSSASPSFLDPTSRTRPAHVRHHNSEVPATDQLPTNSPRLHENGPTAEEPHDPQMDEFFRIMRNVQNARTEARARGIRWPPIDVPGRYDHQHHGIAEGRRSPDHDERGGSATTSQDTASMA